MSVGAEPPRPIGLPSRVQSMRSDTRSPSTSRAGSRMTSFRGSPPFGRAGSIAMRGGTGGVFPTATSAVARAPYASPSFGVTVSSN